MALGCLTCGGHGPGRLVAGRWSCDLCGAPRYAIKRPLLIVTGAAASGKSGVCALVASEQGGLVALDVDVLAGGAAAVTGHADYHAFWAYLLAITLELHQNGTDVVWCGICRPEQVADQPAGVLDAFSAVELLVLSCERAVHLRRLADRPGGEQAAGRAGFHAALNDDLRAAASVGHVRVTHLDTTGLTAPQARARALTWLQERTTGSYPQV